MHGNPDLIFVYGALMGCFPTLDRLGPRDQLESLGPARVDGQVYDLGPYPALKRGPGLVSGELFRALSPQVIPVMDRFEACIPGDEAASEYLRLATPTLPGNRPAWAYFYNREVDPETLITDGDYLARFAAKTGADTPEKWRAFFDSRPV